MGKQHKQRSGKLRRVLNVSGGFTATNSIDPAVPASGIIGKNGIVRNFEIPEGIFKRELEEYLSSRKAPA